MPVTAPTGSTISSARGGLVGAHRGGRSPPRPAGAQGRHGWRGERADGTTGSPVRRNDNPDGGGGYDGEPNNAEHKGKSPSGPQQMPQGTGGCARHGSRHGGSGGRTAKSWHALRPVEEGLATEGKSSREVHSSMRKSGHFSVRIYTRRPDRRIIESPVTVLMGRDVVGVLMLVLQHLSVSASCYGSGTLQ